MKYYYKKTKFGYITICEENSYITNVSFGKIIQNAEFLLTPLIEKTFSELEEYFDLKRKVFDIPINPKGTDFQKKVWSELIKIPFNKTLTYKDIALKIGNNKAYRAVGSANNKNPIAIIIPCHRVIGSSNTLKGYNYGLEIKEKLLKLEGVDFIKK